MKFEAVLFDCDGVLVDSEPLTIGVLRDLLAESGWTMTLAECMVLFVGKTVMDEAPAIEAHTGKPLTEAWMLEFRARRNHALQTRLEPIPGIHAALQAVHTAYAGISPAHRGPTASKSSCNWQKWAWPSTLRAWSSVAMKCPAPSPGPMCTWRQPPLCR